MKKNNNDIISIKVGDNKFVGIRMAEKKYFVNTEELNKEVDKIIFSKPRKLIKRRNK